MGRFLPPRGTPHVPAGMFVKGEGSGAPLAFFVASVAEALALTSPFYCDELGAPGGRCVCVCVRVCVGGLWGVSKTMPSRRDSRDARQPLGLLGKI